MPIDIENDTLETALKKLKAREETFMQLEKIANLGSWEIDLATKTSLWSKQSYAIYGEDESAKPTLNLFLSHVIPEDLEKIQAAIQKVLQTDKVLTERCRITRKNDVMIRHVFLSAQTLYDDTHTAIKIIGTTQDITKQIENEAVLLEQKSALHHQANHDTLTGLANRVLFKDRLEQNIVLAKRKKEQFALLFIDLDQFKKINDSLGHHIGDEVLKESAQRLENTLRDNDTLSRFGGDEFTILLYDIKSAQGAAKVAKKLIEVIREPFNIEGHSLYISLSVGISIYPDDATEENDLIKFADAAMYRAKEQGRDNYQFYSKEMTAVAFERVVLESSLRIAIKEEQFLVYFQPQVHIETGNVVGVEALVRWLHPTLGLVTPAKFILIAQESGLIIEIDSIVMKTAMKQVVQWHKEGYNPGRLALNLSMKQLNDQKFIKELLATMEALDFNPIWLEFEVTESHIMQNPEMSIVKLHQLTELGIEIAIDDFGTGYSSLSYLKKLPLDKLKIDQSFIKDIPMNEDDMAITKAIIALGKSLNLTIIAEGVETQAQKEFLADNNCDIMQGYFYSRPVPTQEVQRFLKA